MTIVFVENGGNLLKKTECDCDGPKLNSWSFLFRTKVRFEESWEFLYLAHPGATDAT